MAKVWRIEAHGDVRELYVVEADTEDEAREMFESGDAGNPYVSEASTEITSIVLDEEG